MKRFTFSLERVLDFRRQQQDVERLRLEALAAERRRLEQDAVRMLEQSRSTRTECASTASLSALELRQAYEYSNALRRSRDEALGQAGRVERQRSHQQLLVVAARRNVRLLELLRTRKLARHSRLAGREQEALAGELHLAKLRREAEKNL